MSGNWTQDNQQVDQLTLSKQESSAISKGAMQKVLHQSVLLTDSTAVEPIFSPTNGSKAFFAGEALLSQIKERQNDQI